MKACFLLATLFGVTGLIGYFWRATMPNEGRGSGIWGGGAPILIPRAGKFLVIGVAFGVIGLIVAVARAF